MSTVLRNFVETMENARNSHQVERYFRNSGGALLVLIGISLLADQYLRTGWLSWVILPTATLLLFTFAIYIQKMGWIIFTSLITGISLGGCLSMAPFLHFSVWESIGIPLMAFALSWAAITLISYRIARKIYWWALIPAAVIGAVGLCSFYSSHRIVDFVLYICVGLGLAFLIWGTCSRLFGLIIPGCLLMGIGPGIFMAWGNLGKPNGLTQTGIMLVWFCLGWMLITVFSRVITDAFVWWPLIPGGILAMVGCGLYIGGNPSGAATFISNTGAIGLIILGIYLMLIRRGIR